MSRSTLSLVAFLALVLLTLATWQAAEGALGPGAVALVATAKVALIGGVFLELDRAWPVWALLSAGLTVAVLGGSALLLAS